MTSHTLKEWAFATRPWSFSASAMPVVVSLAFLFAIHANVNWANGVWALLNIVVAHAAGNLWSDYFDHRRGVDAQDTYGVKILTSGQFTPREILRFSLLLQSVAAAAGLLLVARTGLPLLWMGLAGIALSLLYPPLKYAALGDVVIILCYAVLPTLGTTYVATGRIVWEVLWVAVPIGLITDAILHVNNTRDIDTDMRAGIRTFAMLLGRRSSALLYCAELFFPLAWTLLLPVALASASSLPVQSPWWMLLALFAVPMAVKNTTTMLRHEQDGVAHFARLDEQTAKLQLLFSLLLSAGLVLSRLL